MDAYQQMENIMKNYIVGGYSQDVFGALMPEGDEDMEINKAMAKTLADKFGKAYDGKRSIGEEYILPKVQYLFQAYHANKSDFLKTLHEDGEEHDGKHKDGHADGGPGH